MAGTPVEAITGSRFSITIDGYEIASFSELQGITTAVEIVDFFHSNDKDVMLSKLRLHAMIRDIKEKGGRIYGISAPSRASTLINYVGLDEAIIDYVCEIEGSLKIGKCVPGTLIPVVEESRLFADQPECAIIFSWHIANELAPKLRAKGYKGTLITPLPAPRIL